MSPDDQLDQVKEKLEDTAELSEERNYESKWAEAYDKWEEEGDRSMIENLIEQRSKVHQLNTLQEIKRKGHELNYDKFDTLVSGTLITAAAIKIHPLILSAWVATGYKLLKDSYRSIESDSETIWQKLDDFGPELGYYIIGTTLAYYFFINLQNGDLVLSQGGTVIQARYDVYNWTVT